MINKKYALILLSVIISWFAMSSTCFAWSNYFRFYNNFNLPVILSFTNQTLDWYHAASIHDLKGGSTIGVRIEAKQLSDEFQFTDGKKHWYSVFDGNTGSIKIAKADEPNSYCEFKYNYSRSSAASYFKAHSEEISPPNCQGSLSAKEFSVVNDRTKEFPRPLAAGIFNVDKLKAAKITESLAQADCGGQGGDNCIIASPDMDTYYLGKQGSTLGQALSLQTQLDQYEPLNAEQFIGAHNAAVSKHYTSNRIDKLNVSYGDPDNYLSVPDLLNSGVRQIELDVEWYKNKIVICHNHVSNISFIKLITCSGDHAMAGSSTSPLNQIANWVNQHPDQFVIIYFDVNEPLDGHISANVAGNLDAEIKQTLVWQDGKSMVFTPIDANADFNLSDGALPATRLSAYKLMHQYHKNIIITNDDGRSGGGPDLGASQYVFTKVENSIKAPMPVRGVNDFVHFSAMSGASTLPVSCTTVDKYNNIINFDSNESTHTNLLRLNGDRTIINYMGNAGDDPNGYRDYFTPTNIRQIADCPVNVFSTNMLGATCGSNDCHIHPTDPRFYSFLWSWQLGYPLKGNADSLAYIDPNTYHFANQPLKAGTYAALCLKRDTQVLAPIRTLTWKKESVTLNSGDPHAAWVAANKACKNAGLDFVFAAPTTAYLLSDVKLALGKLQSKLLINYYQKQGGTWIANSQDALFQSVKNVSDKT